LIYKYDISNNTELNKAKWGIQFNTGDHHFPSGPMVIYQNTNPDNVGDLDYIGSNILQSSLIPNYNKILYLGNTSELVGTHKVGISDFTEKNTQKNYNIDINLRVAPKIKKVDKVLLYYNDWNFGDTKIENPVSTIKSKLGKMVITYLGFLNDGIYFAIDKLIPEDEISINISFRSL
jgi:hypothetical protein